MCEVRILFFPRWRSSNPNYHLMNRRNQFSCKMNNDKSQRDEKPTLGRNCKEMVSSLKSKPHAPNSSRKTGSRIRSLADDTDQKLPLCILKLSSPMILHLTPSAILSHSPPRPLQMGHPFNFFDSRPFPLLVCTMDLSSIFAENFN